MKKIISLALAVLLLVGIAIPVMASEVFDANYLTTIQVTNSGTALTNEVVVFTLSTPEMISNSMLADNASDAAMLTGTGGSDIIFMPGLTDTWCSWVSSAGAGSTLNQYLYTGGATGGKIRYFPGTLGMTTSDNATDNLEFGDNFTYSTSGWINTDNGIDKYIFQKEQATKVYVSPTVSENITAALMASSNSTVTQNLQDSFATISAGAALDGTRCGERFDNFNGDIDGALFYLEKANTPTGTAYVRVRLVSDDSILATLGSIDVSTLSAVSFEWKTFNSANVTSDEKNIRISFEYTDGDNTNYVKVGLQTSNVLASGQQTIYKTSWADTSTQDVTILVGYYPYTAVSATGVTSGEHEVNIAMESPFFGIGVDNTTALLPITANLTLNAPLWQTECSSSPFTTIDSNALTATVATATWSGVNGYTFDGGNDLITITDDASIQNIFATGGSLSMWVNPSSSIVGGLQSINKVGWNVYFNNIAGGRTAPTFFMDFDANDGYWNITTGLLVDTFSHYCVTMANTTAGTVPALYVNGELVVTTVGQASTGNPITDAGSNLLIGNRPALDKDFLGIIGEVKIYDSVLTQEEISQNYNATRWKYEGDTSRMVKSTLESVPNNDNDIVSFQNNVMPYVEYQEITIDGVPQQDIKWEYGSTFHNSAHGGDDATPTFRTASSDADLSAAIISQEGLVTASTPATSFGDAYTPNWGADTPAGLYTEGDDSYGIGGINIGELVTAAADDAGQDATSWHIILAFTLAIGALILVYGLTHSSKLGQRGSLILSLLASGGVLVYFYSQGTIAGWVLIPFGLMALLLAMWRKSPSPVD